VTISSRPSSASLGSAQEQARQILAKVQAADAKVSLLGQKWDEAQLKLANAKNLITHTEQIVAAAGKKVHSDRQALKQAAINYYINAGSLSQSNPIFSSSGADFGAAGVYTHLAEGNLSSSVAALKNSSLVLTQQRSILHHQVHLAFLADKQAAEALGQAQAIQSQLKRVQSHISGEIAWYVHQQEAAAAAKALRVWKQTHHGQPPQHNGGSSGYFPAPPPNSSANIAVRAALSFIGVPYVWGGASRYGVDCSGLVMLAWRAAGVYLPHFSGAQYYDTVRVPLWDLRPGDLLFYGWHGDEHVTMYVGHGMMVEAPYSGQTVHVTPVRLGYGFAGAGRVR
jgi:cell wall-associated NlpC family hydrolase